MKHLCGHFDLHVEVDDGGHEEHLHHYVQHVRRDVVEQRPHVVVALGEERPEDRGRQTEVGHCEHQHQSFVPMQILLPRVNDGVVQRLRNHQVREDE